MVKIRLLRAGERNRVFYRLVAVDSRKKRDGAYIEVLGTYNPIPSPSKKDKPKYDIKSERVLYWLKNGAQPTETIVNTLKDLKIWDKFLESKQKKVKPKKKRKLSAAKVAKKKEYKKNGKPKKINHVKKTDAKVENATPTPAPNQEQPIQPVSEEVKSVQQEENTNESKQPENSTTNENKE